MDIIHTCDSPKHARGSHSHDREAPAIGPSCMAGGSARHGGGLRVWSGSWVRNWISSTLRWRSSCTASVSTGTGGSCRVGIAVVTSVAGSGIGGSSSGPGGSVASSVGGMLGGSSSGPGRSAASIVGEMMVGSRSGPGGSAASSGAGMVVGSHSGPGGSAASSDGAPLGGSVRRTRLWRPMARYQWMILGFSKES
jgi:hypothetical protein